MRCIFYGLTALIGFGAPAYAQEQTVIPKTVMLFGDSIVAGYGLNATDVLSEQLQAKLKQKGHFFVITNAGVSGDTTSGGRSRLEWTLNRQKPDIVVLALGGNDLLRGIPVSVTQENLRVMLETLKTQKIPTILSAVQAPPSFGEAYSKEFNAMYPAVAKEYAVPLYPFLLTNTFGRKELMQGDQIHPNAKGAGVIADGLSDYLIQHYGKN